MSDQKRVCEECWINRAWGSIGVGELNSYSHHLKWVCGGCYKKTFPESKAMFPKDEPIPSPAKGMMHMNCAKCSRLIETEERERVSSEAGRLGVICDSCHKEPIPTPYWIGENDPLVKGSKFDAMAWMHVCGFCHKDLPENQPSIHGMREWFHPKCWDEMNVEKMPTYYERVRWDMYSMFGLPSLLKNKGPLRSEEIRQAVNYKASLQSDPDEEDDDAEDTPILVEK